MAIQIHCHLQRIVSQNLLQCLGFHPILDAVSSKSVSHAMRCQVFKKLLRIFSVNPVYNIIENRVAMSLWYVLWYISTSCTFLIIGILRSLLSLPNIINSSFSLIDNSIKFPPFHGIKKATGTSLFRCSIVTRVSRFVNEFHILKATFKFCTRLSTFVMTFPFFSLLLWYNHLMAEYFFAQKLDVSFGLQIL